MDADRETNETGGGCRCIAAVGADGYDIDGAVGYDYGCPHPRCHEVGKKALLVAVVTQAISNEMYGIPFSQLVTVEARRVVEGLVAAVVDGLCTGSNQGV